MAYETGSATDLQDLFAKLSTFATANGWTEDRRDNVNGIFALSKNSIFVSWRWNVADPQFASMHQATVALPSSGTEPGDATGDSNNGYNTSTSHVNSNLDNERHVELDDGPFPSYYFFENDSSPAYLHVVVEVSSNIFTHFGMGELDKVGDGWTGGEYAYGHRRTGSELGTNSTTLLDGYQSTTNNQDPFKTATIRCTGMPNQRAGSKWGVVSGQARGSLSTLSTDVDGDQRYGVQGGFRAGPFTTPWGVVAANRSTGLVPMYSMPLFWFDDLNDHLYLMGWHADVRGMNIRGFAAKEEITIGSDTWVIFPMAQRDIVDSQATAYSGIAYKKVTA